LSFIKLAFHIIKKGGLKMESETYKICRDMAFRLLKTQPDLIEIKIIVLATLIGACCGSIFCYIIYWRK